jgi:uncharacterized protein YndB with AHSA1/START domain
MMATAIKKNVLINAPASIVWETLTNPVLMTKWMGEPEMKIEVITDWELGSPMIIKGFHHVKFENKGKVLQFEPLKILQYSHLSSLSHLPESPENYAIITFSLVPEHEKTSLTVSVENFPTETIFKHLEFYWKTTAELIKRMCEEIKITP